MITNVYFVRHAEPDRSQHDELTRGLTAKGQKDAVKLADVFAEVKLDGIYSSPYRRAVDTVSGIAARHGVDIQLMDDFRERRISDGWIEDFDAFVRAQWRDFDFSLPGGESLHTVQRRNVSALNCLLERHCGQNIMIGSHGTAMSTVINFYDGSFGEAEFIGIKNKMPWTVRFRFEGKKFIEYETIKAPVI